MVLIKMIYMVVGQAVRLVIQSLYYALLYNLVSTQTVEYPLFFFQAKLVFQLEEKKRLAVCVNIAY